MATAFLTRLNINTAWFDDQMKKRPNVARYWEKVYSRPSYKKAEVVLLKPWYLNTFTVTILFLTISLILSLLITGIAALFVEFGADWWKISLTGAVGIYLLILMSFIIMGCK